MIVLLTGPRFKLMFVCLGNGLNPAPLVQACNQPGLGTSIGRAVLFASLGLDTFHKHVKLWIVWAFLILRSLYIQDRNPENKIDKMEGAS